MQIIFLSFLWFCSGYIENKSVKTLSSISTNSIIFDLFSHLQSTQEKPSVKKLLRVRYLLKYLVKLSPLNFQIKTLKCQKFWDNRKAMLESL